MERRTDINGFDNRSNRMLTGICHTAHLIICLKQKSPQEAIIRYGALEIQE